MSKETKIRTVLDGDGNEVVIGCGIIEGQRMFWIDTPQETVTFVISDADDLLKAIKKVLK